ncbi:MAG: hypothetical protein R6U32_04605 [Candidatus Woesearchaeota archaeon]
MEQKYSASKSESCSSSLPEGRHTESSNSPVISPIIKAELYLGFGGKVMDYSFSSNKDTPLTLKEVMGFIAGACSALGIDSTINYVHAEDHQHYGGHRAICNNMFDHEIIDELCEGKSAPYFDIDTINLNVKVMSSMCRPGYAPLKMQEKPVNDVRIKSSPELADKDIFRQELSGLVSRLIDINPLSARGNLDYAIENAKRNQ